MANPSRRLLRSDRRAASGHAAQAACASSRAEEDCVARRRRASVARVGASSSRRGATPPSHSYCRLTHAQMRSVTAAASPGDACSGTGKRSGRPARRRTLRGRTRHPHYTPQGAQWLFKPSDRARRTAFYCRKPIFTENEDGRSPVDRRCRLRPADQVFNELYSHLGKHKAVSTLRRLLAVH